MKTSKKKKAVKILERIANVLEKCGGPGGTPGPCPTGDSKREKYKAAVKKQKEAHQNSSAALELSKKSGHPLGLAFAESAMTNSTHAIRAYQRAVPSGAAARHKDAAEQHKKAALAHAEASGHSSEVVSSHIKASKTHEEASALFGQLHHHTKF